MIEVISTTEPKRLAAWRKRLGQRNVALDTELMNCVAAIVEQVRIRGDAALIDYARELDRYAMGVEELKVAERQIAETAAKVEPEVLAALREAIRRVRAFHEHEREDSWTIDDENGVRLGQRVTPIE